MSSINPENGLKKFFLPLSSSFYGRTSRVNEQEMAEGADMATVLTYLKYFVEHMKDLLIDHCNPILRARYFGVIFDQVPSYAEINCGTTEIEKIPGVNELFKLAHSKDVSLVQFYTFARTQFQRNCE